MNACAGVGVGADHGSSFRGGGDPAVWPGEVAVTGVGFVRRRVAAHGGGEGGQADDVVVGEVGDLDAAGGAAFGDQVAEPLIGRAGCRWR